MLDVVFTCRLLKRPNHPLLTNVREEIIGRSANHIPHSPHLASASVIWPPYCPHAHPHSFTKPIFSPFPLPEVPFSLLFISTEPNHMSRPHSRS